MHWPVCLQHEISRAVCRQQDSRKNRHRYRVPVQKPYVAAHAEIREEGHREIALGIEWNTSLQIARGDAENNGQQKTGKREHEVPELLPEAIVNMAGNLEG